MKTFDHVGLDPIEMETITIDGKRYYVTPSGNKYPSITTVIGNNSKKQAGLAKWRKRVGKEKAQAISTRSSGRGTRFHKLSEDYLNNELDTKKYTDQPLPWIMFHSCVNVLDKINNIYLQEAALYSDYLKVAGRVDCIAEYDGVLSIIDFKTSKEKKRESYIYDYYVQETAYACCLQELYGIKVKQLVTIIACENGDVQVFVVSPKKEYFVRLQEYITEYQEKHDRKSGG
ncbi:exonuclease [Synechococcus phage S-PM2]|uniref:Exonuclease n=1 Tax=Synechococcus phage S-PM2 TaxID=238854 RepID=Q5GQE1_BPSYP|nr:exonuclease [Synechococcus phage S-PM2]CAF34261.1 exonuclease [Synechococcus phage S-PM2]CFW42411.1 exonuclease [Synechococcus phage S-PM2]